MTPLHLVLLFATILVWGCNFVAIKTGLQGMPPIFLCFARFLFSCLPAIFFIKRPPAPFKKVMGYSAVMFVLQFSLLFIGMRAGITAALASVLLQFQSFFAIGFAILLMGEKFHFFQAIGGFVALLGIILVATHIGGEITPLGLPLVLSAAVMWAYGSILAKKMEKGSGLSLVVWSSFYACPPLLLLSLILEGPDAIIDSLKNVSWIHFGSVCYISYLATLFGFGNWNRLLQFYPISKLAPFTLIVPIIGMFSSALLLGEPLQWWKLTAACLILGGLGINLLASRSTAPVKAPQTPENFKESP